MKILFGTQNLAKFSYLKRCFNDLPITLIGLNDLYKPIIEIDESGKYPLENAKIKAKSYYKEYNMPVFSCDTGLFIFGLNEDRQPGTHVRTINGKRLSDDEMIEYYSSLSKEFGGKMYARYENAIYLIINDNEHYYYDGDDIKSEKFIISKTSHTKKVEGFPIDSLAIDIISNKYYYDIDYIKDYFSVDKGFHDFMEKVLK